MPASDAAAAKDMPAPSAAPQLLPPAPGEVDICDQCGQFSFGFGMLLTLGVMLSHFKVSV